MTLKETVKIINGAPIEGVNPLPRFRGRKPNVPKTGEGFPEELKKTLGCHTKTLPYTVQDRYSRKRIPLRLKCITLENEYLRAEFLPEYGGRLYSLFDKENGVDLVMRNPVIQPGNLAIRNAWLSGGIEWNIGSIGHTATTCDNVFCARLKDGNGNDFLRIYEFERMKSVFWQVDFHLPDGSKHLIVHVRAVNPCDFDTTTYWWSNVAAVDEGGTRVLASGESIISFVGSDMRYERLPYITAMPDADVSYPSNATRSFDYFIQPNTPDECTWEAAAFPDGSTLYERSTPPLSFKKMFCWGNHHAGNHWQEFLSDGEGTGYYVEIQAGIAPSQLHDRILHAHETVEWTQCFGGVRGDKDKLHNRDYFIARDYLGTVIGERISSEAITELNERLKVVADTTVTEKDLIHLGSGFGATEIARMEKDGDGKAPKTMLFPRFTVGKEESPWLYLIENGILPPENGRYYTPSFNVSDKWLRHIKNSLDREGGRTWYSLMQYGIAVYDGVDNTKLAADAYSDGDRDYRAAEAERAWKASIELCPTAITYRNLAILEEQRGNSAQAEAYYDLALSCEGAFDDFALTAEFMGLLLRNGKHSKVWSIYETLPENCKTADRVRIFTASAAVKLDKFDYLDGFFKEEHYDIREGENSLTDVWFEFCARRMAKERGIDPTDTEALDKLIDEAWETCPPDPRIDFRMSFVRRKGYRV